MSKIKMCRPPQDLLHFLCGILVYFSILFLLRTFPLWSCVYKENVICWGVYPLEYSLFSCCHINLNVAILSMTNLCSECILNSRQSINKKSRMTAKRKMLFLCISITITTIVVIKVLMGHLKYSKQSMTSFVLRCLGC